MTELFEKTVSSEQLYDGKVVKLFKDIVELPNGNTSVREIVRHVGAVCVVPITDKGEIILVKQFRYPFGRVLLELPAGKLDSPDEDPLEAAKRELSEERGLLLRALNIWVHTFPPLPYLMRKYICILQKVLKWAAVIPMKMSLLRL